MKSGDTCSSIAAANSLTASEIEGFNKVKTWGFDSCANLGLGVKICLSKGDAPLPAPQKGAICGPTVPGTKQPASGTNITNLNPCPLNACCNIWGQCGITGDFCVPSTGKFGNPGTGPPGSNGCASSCGRKITNNGQAPSSFISVGYYESWNMDRPCLTMRAKSIAALKYTHIHWGFGKISTDMSVSINDTYKQWDDFKSLSASGIKTVLSFGGWGDSTDPATYGILRKAVSPDGRKAFTDNVAKFAKDQGLDGIDIDWEYPGVSHRIISLPTYFVRSPSEALISINRRLILRAFHRARRRTGRIILPCCKCSEASSIKAKVFQLQHLLLIGTYGHSLLPRCPSRSTTSST